jgi:subtilisin family serine protease
VAVKIGPCFEILELRKLLNAAYDLVGVTALRNDSNFSTIDGRGVSVAVIDTGLDITHPLIAPNYKAGADIVTGAGTPTVTNPHGTHVAGIVGSKPDASRGYEGGVAPGVGIIGLQVFTQGSNGEVGADNRSIERALQWVIDHRAQYSIVAVTPTRCRARSMLTRSTSWRAPALPWCRRRATRTASCRTVRPVSR